LPIPISAFNSAPCISKLIKLNGIGQKKSGTPYLCPVCAASESATIALNNSFAPGSFAITSNAPGYASSFGNQIFSLAFTAQGLVSPLSFFGGNPLSTIFGSTPVPNVIKPGGTYTDQAGKSLTIQPGQLGQGIPCPVCNPQSPFNKDAAKNPDIKLRAGYSPSSFHGAWSQEPKKLLLPTLYQKVLPKLAQIESQMGIGGSEIVEITKHKIETIGTVMNDWGSVRVDPIGKMSPAFVAVTPYMPVTVERPTPLIEQVQVDDLPGGTYTLNVCNKYNVMVGSGGVNLKSYGVINITGSMTNIAGEQVNIGSANEVNIDGGKRLNLVGDIVSIKQRYNEQVILDSSVGITGNLIVKGGIFVEGNLTALSTSTPQLVRTTDAAVGTARAHPDGVLGTVVPMSTQGIISPDTGSIVPNPIPETGTPVYMGYTDPGSWVGYCPPDFVIGEVTVIGIPGVPALGVKFPIKSTGFFVQGTGPAEDLKTKTTRDDRLREVESFYSADVTTASTAVSAKWFAMGLSDQTYTKPSIRTGIPGVSIINSDNTGYTLRGLPGKYVQSIYNATGVGGATQLPSTGPFGYTADGASQLLPMMVVGAGGNPDGISCAEHSHTYSEGDEPSHALQRAIFAGNAQNGNVPTKAESQVMQTSQDPAYIAKTWSSLQSLLKLA
jgi:hypothetical protein